MRHMTGLDRRLGRCARGEVLERLNAVNAIAIGRLAGPAWSRKGSNGSTAPNARTTIAPLPTQSPAQKGSDPAPRAQGIERFIRVRDDGLGQLASFLPTHTLGLVDECELGGFFIGTLRQLRPPEADLYSWSSRCERTDMYSPEAIPMIKLAFAVRHLLPQPHLFVTKRQVDSAVRVEMYLFARRVCPKWGGSDSRHRASIASLTRAAEA